MCLAWVAKQGRPSCLVKFQPSSASLGCNQNLEGGYTQLPLPVGEGRGEGKLQ